MPTISFHAPDLARALRLVKHAAAKEENRPILATILFEADDKGFRLVAADNYRIGIADVDASGDLETFGRVPLPVDELPAVLAVLAGWKEAVTVAADGEHLTFTTKIRTVTVRTMHGTYPRYETILGGDRTDIGINPKFLSDLGKATKDAEARLSIGAWNTPVEVEIESLDYREYIMPIRLEGMGMPPKESAA